MPTAALALPDVSARRFFNGADRCWHVQVTQGETYVTGAANEVLTTVLGSCIAACIRDPQAGVGGMNHFLLAQGQGADQDAMRYGVNAMEILINGLLARGAVRGRLEAKLFGGAAVIVGLSDVGAGNARFARAYLEAEGIALAGGDTGGIQPRRVQYWPLTGRARRLSIPAPDANRLIARERQAAQTQASESHDVELF
jgi:chemotaxis protein CheD